MNSNNPIDGLPNCRGHETIAPGSPRFHTTQMDGRHYKNASAWLGVPGQVPQRRDLTVQRRLSRGTGDDACHLLASEYGMPGGVENLSLGNRFMNRYGAFRQLERFWDQQLQGGRRVFVSVTDVSRDGENRPFFRKASWSVLDAEGHVHRERLLFMNPHSPESRIAQGIRNRVDRPQKNNVIEAAARFRPAGRPQ